MKRILFLFFLMPTTYIYSLTWGDVKNKFPGLPPTIFTLLKDPDYLLKTGHATTARFVSGLQDFSNLHSKDLIYGRNAIHFAAESGSGGTVKNLLNAGYAVNVSDNYGNTPLHFAAASGSGDGVIVLLKFGAKVDARNQHGDTSLIFSILSCNLIGADAILNSIDLKFKNDFLKTAGAGGLTPLQQSIYSCPKLVRILLNHGANPDYTVPYSQTAPPLHIAAELGLSDVVGYLLDAGANVMIRDNLGKTALHKAASARNSISVEKLLAKGGQDLMNVKDNAGKMAIDYTESGSGLRNWFTRWKLGKWF